MHIQRLFSQTLRQPPADVSQPGMQFLLRSGYVQELAPGQYAMLPLGRRVLDHLAGVVHLELAQEGAIEISLPPVLHPESADCEGQWRTTFGIESDRLSLPVSALPGFLQVMKAQLQSYKQLPLGAYHITQMQGDEHPSGRSLAYSRTAEVIEAFFLDRVDGETKSRKRVEDRLENTFIHMGVPFRKVNGLPGDAGEAPAVEFIYPSEYGRTEILTCPACGASSTITAADFYRQQNQEEPAELSKVATPGCKSIESLANFLGIPPAKTAKAVFLTAEFAQPDRKQLIFCVLRGDRELNEEKLRFLLGARSLSPSTEGEIRAAGATPGYASPVGLKNVRVVADAEIPMLTNLVAGANEEGYHLVNVNYSRDFTAGEILPIAAARAGDGCPHYGHAMQSWTGISLGNAFKVKNSLLESGGCTYRAENGADTLPVLFVARLNLYRMLACLGEEYQDERGLRLPALLAPFPVHMVVLGSSESPAGQALSRFEKLLQQANLDVLVDDRSDSAGVKFMDADLIGCPFRLTLSERSLKQGGVELKVRSGGEARILREEELIDQLRALLRLA